MTEPAIRMTQINDSQIPHERPLLILGVKPPVTIYGTVTSPGIMVVCTLSGPEPRNMTAVATGTSWSIAFGNLIPGPYTAAAHTQPKIEPGDSFNFQVPVV
jgi:hypothetical protein